VVVAAALMGASAAAADVRIERSVMEAEDSVWAAQPGHVLVHWPATAPGDWPRRDRIDSVGAVIAGSAVLVGDFERLVTPPAREGRAVARWMDGVSAATERVIGEGCVREVAVPFPSRGDLALGESARRFVAALSVPCGGARDLAPLDAAKLALLRGDESQKGARTLVAPEEEGGKATTWLLLGAALLLLIELPLRRSRAGAEQEGAA
jgi:hypothetical protein